MSTAEKMTIDGVRSRLGDHPFAMVTSIDERGTLSSRPVTVMKIDDSGDVWFLVDKHADWVKPLDTAPVNASVANDRTWVSFAGRAEIIEDDEVVTLLTNPMADIFFEEGGEPVALKIVTDRVEWWASPNKAVQLVELLKAKVTDQEPKLGDSGTIDV